MNQIQATAMIEGVRRKKTLWSKAGRKQLESLVLAPWAARRRQDLLELVDRLDSTINELTAAIEQEARKRPEVLRLMTHPGVGPIKALAFVLTIGSPDRFACEIAGSDVFGGLGGSLDVPEVGGLSDGRHGFAPEP
jgi:transposase